MGEIEPAATREQELAQGRGRSVRDFDARPAARQRFGRHQSRGTGADDQRPHESRNERIEIEPRSNDSRRSRVRRSRRRRRADTAPAGNAPPSGATAAPRANRRALAPRPWRRARRCAPRRPRRTPAPSRRARRRGSAPPGCARDCRCRRSARRARAAASARAPDRDAPRASGRGRAKAGTRACPPQGTSGSAPTRRRGRAPTPRPVRCGSSARGRLSLARLRARRARGIAAGKARAGNRRNRGSSSAWRRYGRASLLQSSNARRRTGSPAASAGWRKLRPGAAVGVVVDGVHRVAMSDEQGRHARRREQAGKVGQGGVSLGVSSSLRASRPQAPCLQ